MTKTIVNGRAFWIVDGMTFASRKAALEYIAGRN